jgi:hypothetical protein
MSGRLQRQKTRRGRSRVAPSGKDNGHADPFLRWWMFLHSMSACRPQISMTSCLTWRGQRAAKSPALSKRFSPMLRPVQSGCIDPPHLQDRYHRAGRGRLQAGPPPSLEIVARVVRTRSYSGLLIDYQAGHRRKTHGLKSSKQIKAAAERAAHRATKGAEGPKPPFAYCSQSET